MWFLSGKKVSGKKGTVDIKPVRKRLEKDFRKEVQKALRKNGFLVYPIEIKKIDIVAEKGDLLYGFETKLINSQSDICMGIGQTLLNGLFVHKSYLTIPKNQLQYIKEKFHKIFKKYGIGLLVVENKELEIIYDNYNDPVYKLNIPYPYNFYKIIFERGSLTVREFKTILGMNRVWYILNTFKKHGLIKITKRGYSYLSDSDLIEVV